MTPATVFVVDDDASVREAIGNLIRSVGLHGRLFDSARDFLATEKPDAPACLVLDVGMPELSGLDCQRRLDDESVREAATSLFRSIGLTTLAFASAEAYLSSGDLDKTSCLVLDVQMPRHGRPDAAVS
jgi:FixJ family two-component response regulator